MNESSKKQLAVFFTYAIVAVLAYWYSLRAFFVSDDFEFLSIVASARSWLVIFEPLVGRYVRPLVVLTYYVCYRIFGLAAWPYHLASLLTHLAATCLVYLVGLRLFAGPQARFLAFLSGLLFLVFSGHSEAVAWPAGIADPILTVFLLISFLCYLRASEPQAPGRFVVLAFVAMLGAVLAKEAWVTYPGIVLAHALLLGSAEPRARRRAAILVAATGATVIVYLAMRQFVFGSITGGYSGLGTSFGTSLWFAEVRAFVLRSFVPSGTWAVRIWRRLDLIVWPLIAGILLWRIRGRDGRVVLFTAVATILALLPVLPLTISVSTTESERFTYLATVFSCLLVVGATAAVLRQRALVIVACGVLMLWHGIVLARNTVRWHEAGEMAHAIIDTYATTVRLRDPGNRQMIFLLNLPDNLMGAYVYRRGFYPAVQLFAPDVAATSGRLVQIASNSFSSLDGRTAASRMSPNRFALDVAPGRFLQTEISSSMWYRTVSLDPASLTVEFTDSIKSALVLHTTAGRIHYVGTAQSKGLPFGFVDTPPGNAVCDAAALRLSGWALDDSAVARVEIATAGIDGVTSLGEAVWDADARPDVASLLPWFPNSRRAGWHFVLPCAAVRRAGDHEVRVEITAIDSDAQGALLGTRLVTTPR
jgi:hypothetical protein